MLTSDAYSFGSLFVVLGIAVWVLIAIGNGAYAGPREKKAVEAFEGGDERAGRVAIRQLNGFVAFEFLLLFAVVIVMVYRWGA